MLLTAGQASKYGQASALIDGFDATYVLADKGYDSDKFIGELEKAGATAMIPPRKKPQGTARI